MSASPHVARIVTVLFSDVTGFTTLAERLDPESVHQVMGETPAWSSHVVRPTRIQIS
jgi:class 3 adenylate cyclase